MISQLICHKTHNSNVAKFKNNSRSQMISQLICHKTHNSDVAVTRP